MGRIKGSLQTLKWRTWSVIQSTVGTVIVISILPIIIPILLLLWIWRCIALLLIRVKYGYWAQVASGMEALFAIDSVGARAIISGVTILKGKVSVSAVRAHLSKRIVEAKDAKGNYLHPKFRQVIEKRCGVVVWSWEENFDISRHVKPMRTQDRRQRLLKDEDDILCELSARTNDPFVRGHARWEVLVAPVKRFGKYFDTDGEDWDYTAVTIRVHHALGDGRSLVGLMVSALVDPPLSDPRPSPVCNEPCEVCTTRIFKTLWSITHLPWVMIRILSRGDSSVLHGSRLGGVKHLAWSPPISLPALKKGRILADVSVNDLLLTGLSAALHKHFYMEGSKVPAHVMTVLPVDVTAPGTLLSLANRISLCTVPLPTIRMSPGQRLKMVHERMNLLKRSPDVMVNYIALDLISNLMPSPLAKRILNTHGVTMVASNMPGPTEQINLFGEPVEDFMFWIPNKSRTGLGVSMLSYCGYVRIGLNVDSNLIETKELAQQLLEDMVTEVENTLVEITPAEEKMEAGSKINTDNISDGSDLTDVVMSHSTDEYDNNQRISSYSDLQSSLDMMRKSYELDTTLDSDDFCPPENLHLLRDNFNATRIEIQSFLTSGHEARSISEKFKTRFNKSDTDINILSTRFHENL